jgi:DNA-binding MarR family transcriptional regulator
MEAAGLVRRLPDPNDRRGIQVELTEEGRKVFDRSAAAQAAKESIVSTALSAREQEQLNGLLRRLMLEFERQEPQGKKKHLG